MKNIILWSVIFFLLILCLIKKRKIRFLSLIFLTSAVTFFQLLTPNGKIIFSVLNFNLTLGALESGIFKSGILILLQLLSKLIVSLNFNFKGKTGDFLTDVFFIYSKLTETDFISEIKHKTDDNQFSKIPPEKNSTLNLIKKIDQKLFSIWEQI
ncbi:MAG: hypothetical protein KBT21_07710 [Treponema sp.]|nr:hypothetical protein [Candidatus Treponema merdequi]